MLSVNEETKDSRRTPGLAAVCSTVILVSVYVLFTVAAQAFAGVVNEGLGLANPENADDVVAALGSAVFGDSVAGQCAVAALVIMVLTSATASTQTTILPTARTTFAMAFHGALPKSFGKAHPRFATPHVSTWAMGLLSAGLYVAMDLFGGGGMVLDAVAACGVAIGFYYGLTALASARLYSGSRLRVEHARAGGHRLSPYRPSLDRRGAAAGCLCLDGGRILRPGFRRRGLAYPGPRCRGWSRVHLGRRWVGPRVATSVVVAPNAARVSRRLLRATAPGLAGPGRGRGPGLIS